MSYKVYQPIYQRKEKNVKKELERALKRLPERERTIMVLYYHENMTLKEIGEAINVSESRVCQLHAQAIMKLRNILSSNRTERLNKSIDEDGIVLDDASPALKSIRNKLRNIDKIIKMYDFILKNYC